MVKKSQRKIKVNLTKTAMKKKKKYALVVLCSLLQSFGKLINSYSSFQ